MCDELTIYWWCEHDNVHVSLQCPEFEEWDSVLVGKSGCLNSITASIERCNNSSDVQLCKV